MKNTSNPTINNVIIIFLKDDLKENPIAIGLLKYLNGLNEGYAQTACYLHSLPRPLTL